MGIERGMLAAGIVCALAGTCSATDFDAYRPDKTGAADVSPLLQTAMQDAVKNDSCLTIRPGRYLVAKPVALPSYLAVVAPEGATLVGTKETDIFQCRRNQGNRIEGLVFTTCRTAIAALPPGDGYFATAHVEKCGFVDCDAGIAADCIQSCTFDLCKFANCRYGIRGGRGYGGRSNAVRIYRSVFNGCSEWGVEIIGSPTHIMDCLFEGCDGGGMALLDAMTATVEGCYFEAIGKVRNHDLLIGRKYLHTGVVTVRGNQFNGVAQKDRILIEAGSGARVCDNFVYMRKGQVFVRHEEGNANVRVEGNFFEGEGTPVARVARPTEAAGKPAAPAALPKDAAGREK